MRRIVRAAPPLLLLACARASAPAPAPAPASASAPALAAAPPPDWALPDADWVPVARSPSADVAVERALYMLPYAPSSAHFHVHVRVTNRTGKDLFLDLRKYHRVLYPNQWGASDELHRSVVDETRLPFPPLGDAAKASLAADARADLLPRASAGAAVEYFIEFNASSRADVDAQSKGHRYVLVVIDGEILVSDGRSVEQVLPPAEDTARDVAVPAPVAWRVVREGARVIPDGA